MNRLLWIAITCILYNNKHTNAVTNEEYSYWETATGVLMISQQIIPTEPEVNKLEEKIKYEEEKFSYQDSVPDSVRKIHYV